MSLLLQLRNRADHGPFTADTNERLLASVFSRRDSSWISIYHAAFRTCAAHRQQYKTKRTAEHDAETVRRDKWSSSKGIRFAINSANETTFYFCYPTISQYFFASVGSLIISRIIYLRYPTSLKVSRYLPLGYYSQIISRWWSFSGNRWRCSCTRVTIVVGFGRDRSFLGLIICYYLLLRLGSFDANVLLFVVLCFE